MFQIIHLDLGLQGFACQQYNYHVLQSGSQPDSLIARNWVFDSPKAGNRFDDSPKHKGSHGTMHKNVIWKEAGFMVKGDFHNTTGKLALINNDEKDEEGDQVYELSRIKLGYFLCRHILSGANLGTKNISKFNKNQREFTKKFQKCQKNLNRNYTSFGTKNTQI